MCMASESTSVLSSPTVTVLTAMSICWGCLYCICEVSSLYTRRRHAAVMHCASGSGMTALCQLCLILCKLVIANCGF